MVVSVWSCGIDSLFRNFGERLVDLSARYPRDRWLLAPTIVVLSAAVITSWPACFPLALTSVAGYSRLGHHVDEFEAAVPKS